MNDSPRDQLQRALGDAYRLDRELGGGGMSHVYVATEIALGREVVVKVLPAEMAGQVSVERFKREIALAARLQHPHVVPLLTAGDAEGLPYFTMPFVSGESLRARLVRQGELPLSEAVRLLREIASALAYAHDRGIVQRDIKPDNVLLSGASAMITDFGVAKALSASSNGDAGSMTSMGVALGTPAYMSPEQASADPAVDHRADIYAFGVLAYELLTGQPPFVGRTPANLLAAHVTEAPDHITKRRASIPPALAALVMRCLEKRAADRPQTAAELVHALDAITTPSGGTQPTTAQVAYRAEPAAPAGPAKSRGAWRLIVAVVVVVLLVGATVARSRGAIGSAPKSIAVLPMDIGADTAHAYLADGLSNELTTRLTKIPGLAVRSYASSKTVRSRSARAAGKELNVGSVLLADLRRNGDRLRVTASLVDAGDETVIWSETFEESDQDQFALQDRLVTAIAGALRVSLSPEAKAVVTKRGTSSKEAHDLVQRARFELDRYTEASCREALALAERATRIDPDYADAWSIVGLAWLFLADEYVSPLEAIAPARAAITRALTLDPAAPEVHAALGSMRLFYDYREGEAAPELERALQLDSANVNAAIFYPSVLVRKGMLDSAKAVGQRALRLNPTSALLTIYAFDLGTLPPDSVMQNCARRRQYAGEVTALRCEAYAMFHLGRSADAIDRLQRMILVWAPSENYTPTFRTSPI